MLPYVCTTPGYYFTGLELEHMPLVSGAPCLAKAVVVSASIELPLLQLVHLPQNIKRPTMRGCGAAPSASKPCAALGSECLGWGCITHAPHWASLASHE